MNNEIKRSPMFYVGDKYKLVLSIKQYFPKYIGKFIEPFVGGGTVFLNTNAEKYLLNDINNSVYRLQRYLSSQSKNPDLLFKNILKVIKKYNLSRSYDKDIIPNELKQRWEKIYYAKYNKQGFNNLRTHYNKNSKKDTLILYVLLIYGFNRMLRFNSNGHFNVPVGNVDFNKNVYNALNGYFATVKNKNIQWYNLDYHHFISSIEFNEHDFIYLDPPYLISQSEYNKLWNSKKESDLLVLLDDLNGRGIKFAISNVVSYKNKVNNIFKRWMKKYYVHDIKSNYISYHNNSKKSIREVLIKNYA